MKIKSNKTGEILSVHQDLHDDGIYFWVGDDDETKRYELSDVGFEIEESDLVGQLKGFDKSVVQLMLINQVEQGNALNIEIFQHHLDASKEEKGFNWGDTKYGFDFWTNTLYQNMQKDRERTGIDIAQKVAGDIKEQIEPKIDELKKSKEIDWEQRRYEIAKAAMQGMLANSEFLKECKKYYEECEDYGFEKYPKIAIDNAIYYADELIKRLKEPNS